MTRQSEPTWPDLLTSLLAGHDLSAAEAAWAMGRIMSGDATPVQVAGFLVALRAKGETVAEVTGIADTMLEHAHRIHVSGETMDIVGTGGDRANTVNISTMASMVVAACGVRIVKHGNRAASSKSGTADCLEELGVDLSLPPAKVVECAELVGITFCFAAVFHPSMRHAGVPRRDLAIPTVFNVLGPLTNPASPTYAAVGVADPRMAPLVAGVFATRGRRTAVFRGGDGLDEITVSTTSTVWWVDDGRVDEFVLDPRRFGVALAPLSDLRGGEAAYNAQVVRDIFAGRSGPIRDAVVLNAGIALAVAGGAPVRDQASFEAAVEAGVERARTALDEGLAAAVLGTWRDTTQRLATA